MSTTLSQYIISEYGEKSSTQTTRSWRAGNSEGIKHPKITQSMINQIGMKNILKQARELEEKHIIKGHWKNMNADLISIDFPMANLDKLYELEHMPNPKYIIQTQISYITKLKADTTKDWLTKYYTSLLDSLSEGNMPQNALDNQFLECLFHLSKRKDYQWKRFFSEEVFHDSKAFEKIYEKRVINVLRKFLVNQEEMEDYEVLAEFGIMTYSQTLAWKGNLVYSIEGNVIDSSSMIYGNLLNAQTLVHSIPVSLTGVKRIMTIENQANYEDMAYQPDTLLIFVHGFPSPKARKFLKHLTSIAEDNTEYYHWGDMDLGGIRIFKYLKEKLFPELRPMKMDSFSYLEAIKAGQGIEFDEDKRKKYMQLDAGELTGLKLCILEHGKDMEQEGIRLS